MKEMAEKKNILITGCCGYIGSYFIGHFASVYNIIGIDDLRTQRYCSLFNLQYKIKFYEQSVQDISVEHLKDVDVVIHLAGTVDAANSFEKRLDLNEDIEDAKHLIELCNAYDILLIFPSSTSVYGVGGEVKEDDDKYLNPQSPYAETKIIIEDYVKNSCKKYLIFRFGTVTGYAPGIRFQTAINKFCYNACLGIPLTVWKQNYEQVRPFLTVNQANISIHRLIKTGIFNETYNVVSENLTPRQIIERIKLYKPINIDWVDTPLLNQYSYNVNDDKILPYIFKDKISFAIDELLQILYNTNKEINYYD